MVFGSYVCVYVCVCTGSRCLSNTAQGGRNAGCPAGWITFFSSECIDVEHFSMQP